MLAMISPLRSGHGHEEENTELGEIVLDDINFDDIFLGFDADGGGCDILPDLEIVDPDDIFADFSFSSGEESAGLDTGAVVLEDYSAGGEYGNNYMVAQLVPDSERKEDTEYLSEQNDEVVSGTSKLVEVEEPESGENRSGRKLSTTTGSHVKKTKKKPKVDWTPELHRRFVQAVEQLGVDKAVPSRILELMGIDSLTRHNIASHLQKYRCHRKHLLAREAEAARWSQRRQMYAGDTKKLAPPPPILRGFIPPAPPPSHQIILRTPLVRPLHVWGHPSTAADRPRSVWPSRHPTPPPPQPWLPSPSMRPAEYPPAAASYWHPHYQMALTQGMLCFPPQLVPPMGFQAPPVLPGTIHPQYPLFRPAAPSSHNAAAAAAAAATTLNQTPSSCNHSPLLFDAHPSNEKIDAAVGDVLAKPWSALPLGLKPPSLESVMVELQRQGVAKVPPSSGG